MSEQDAGDTGRLSGRGIFLHALETRSCSDPRRDPDGVLVGILTTFWSAICAPQGGTRTKHHSRGVNDPRGSGRDGAASDDGGRSRPDYCRYSMLRALPGLQKAPPLIAGLLSSR